MKPYCYIFQFYERVEVFPTLRQLIEFFISKEYQIYSTLQDTRVTCHFSDGKRGDLKMDNLVERVKLNFDEIRIEAKELIEQNKKYKSEFFTLDEESIFQNMINKRSYKWKDLDTVDWELIENNLHENIYS